MKINARYLKSLYNAQGQAEVTIKVDNFRHIALLNELDTAKEYRIQIDEVKSHRSIEQNSLLWQLLHELEKATREPAIDWYVKCLIETGAVVDYIWGAERTEDTLKKMFRAIQRMKFEKMKNIDGWWYRVIVGSSKYNVQEMNMLIETVMRYCAEHNIETEV